MNEFTYSDDLVNVVTSERKDGLPLYFITSMASAETVRSVRGRWCSHIACLSSEADSPSQWERYGDGGKGVAIGFDREALQKLCIQQLRVSLFPVSYDRSHHEATIRKGGYLLDSG